MHHVPRVRAVGFSVLWAVSISQILDNGSVILITGNVARNQDVGKKVYRRGFHPCNAIAFNEAASTPVEIC